MIHQIALDPRLNLSADEFVAAWNASEYAEQATATLKPATRGDVFLPMEVAVALIGAGAAIPATIVATFVSDWLRERFIDGPPKVTVTTIETPDGQPILVIKQTET